MNSKHSIVGPTLKNFLFTHVEYTHPNVIFQNCENNFGNISLMDVTTSHVCFCVTNTEIDVYDNSR